MSGDYFTHNSRQPPIVQHLKWTEDGELSDIDKNKILAILNTHGLEIEHKDRNNGWRTGSPMQG